MADNSHIYITAERFTANFSKALWVKFVTAMRNLDVIGGANQFNFQEVGNNDRFEYVADDPETPEDESVWYSNVYQWEARWAAGVITAENVKAKLVTLFDVANPDLVTYTISRPTFGVRQTVVATYWYDGSQRIRIALMGCTSGANICTWRQSGIEMDAYMDINYEEWNGVAL